MQLQVRVLLCRLLFPAGCARASGHAHFLGRAGSSFGFIGRS